MLPRALLHSRILGGAILSSFDQLSREPSKVKTKIAPDSGTICKEPTLVWIRVHYNSGQLWFYSEPLRHTMAIKAECFVARLPYPRLPHEYDHLLSLTGVDTPDVALDAPGSFI